MNELILSNNVEELKEIILNLHIRINGLELSEIILKEQKAALEHRIFGRKSERWTVEDCKQSWLFNEAETFSTVLPEKKKATIKVKGYTRRKPGRKPLPENLPRIEKVFDLSKEEKACKCGSELTKIGEDTSEKLDIIPPKFTVEKWIRPKYACDNCEGVEDEENPAVKMAPLPEQLIPKSIATPGLLAYILTSKFVDGLNPICLLPVGVQSISRLYCSGTVQIEKRIFLNVFLKALKEI